MNNLIYIDNNNSFLINKKIKELNKDDYSIEYYNLSDIDINEIIINLDTYNFINPNRIVICTNINNIYKYDLTRFEKYIDNPNKDNVLVLVGELDNRKKISKKINKLFVKLDININPINYIKDNLKDYKIDTSTIMYLIEITNSNIASIDNEINKLKMYKLEEKEINKEDIEQICYRNINDSDDYIFEFVEAILTKDRRKAMKIYDDLRKINIEIYSLIGLISSSIRSMLQIKVLENYSDQDIKDILKLHPYRIKKLREANSKYTKAELIKTIKDLYNLDLKVKSGIIDAALGMELFIVNDRQEGGRQDV